MRTFASSTPAELELRLRAIRDGAALWLGRRRNSNGPGFSFCEQALVPVELNATTCGIELWVMLGLPLSSVEKTEWINHLQLLQNPQTGLVADPTWKNRQAAGNDSRLRDGDTFFTMTSAAALEALGAHFRHPIAYLAKENAGTLSQRTDWIGGCHHPYTVGDYGRLILANLRLGVPGAEGQWRWLNTALHEQQDSATGLWPSGGVTAPFTPSINRTFHMLRSSWNLSQEPYSLPDRMVDSCLAACEDDSFYGWESGFACNDLDLALVAYSAAQWTSHRVEELRQWAIRRLPMLLAVWKTDGGFTFYHERAMETHGGIRMSEGGGESDMWGTLMYLGAIKMMSNLAYPELPVPWAFSRVHAVSGGAKP